MRSDEQRARRRARRAANRDELNAKRKAWRDANREAYNARGAARQRAYRARLRLAQAQAGEELTERDDRPQGGTDTRPDDPVR